MRACACVLPSVREKTVPEPVCLNNERDLINLKKTLLSLQSKRLGPQGTEHNISQMTY